MNARFLRRVAGTSLGLAALVLLAGCADFPAWGGWSQTPSSADMAMVMQRTEPVPPPAAPAQLSPPRRPPKTEVSFDDGK